METADSVVRSVVQKFLDRAAFGKKKYGTTLDRTDLSTVDWIVHAQEELMDGILYLEKLKKEVGEKEGEKVLSPNTEEEGCVYGYFS